ncbi:ABC transporter ATP-binding protein [Streptosporangium pseudovulgare]|uniref:ABC transporter ATP-binding protein n=1 Tax=Streptosporangium pseudovulgare TaxID=35765 RepID=A0ABQ2QR19_9ACTN|nr:ABC transporter ATP-binding protein [Streptosporangium pseudovulgare]GGP92181.1 ABC transporter ATP-binding protein [Streptosporangium pseudovulgare]
MEAIEVTDLRKTYGDTRAVDGVTFTVRAGETFGIVGHNGAGKTTTVECLIGLRRPDAGAVRVLGEDPARRRRALAQRIGAQLQESSLPERIKVAEALRMFGSFYRDAADWRQLMERWGLQPLARKAFGDLSGGQKQRLMLALALVGAPEVVVLDELTTGLDPIARRETWRLVNDLKMTGTTVVLVSHYFDETEALCDRVAVLARGRVRAMGTPGDIVAQTGTASLEEAYFALEGADR